MTQLYTSCSAADCLTLAFQLLRCISDVADWMASNRLKLNAEKTQFIWLGSPYHYTESVCHLPLFVGGTAVSPVDAVLNLGVTFDAQLTMKNHVDIVVRSCFFQIRQLRSF